MSELERVKGLRIKFHISFKIKREKARERNFLAESEPLIFFFETTVCD